MITVKYKIIPLLVLLLFVSGLALAGCSSKQEETTQGKIDDLDHFSAFTLKNELFTQENFQDYDITVCFFWAPWSDVSVYEMGHVGAFIKTLPDNIHMVTIAFDGTEKDVKEALKKVDLSKTTTLMSGDGDFKTVSDEIVNVPTAVLVNAKGQVIGSPVVGASEDVETTYLKKINKQLKKMKLSTVTPVDPEEDTEDKDSKKTTEDTKNTDKTEEGQEETKDTEDQNGNGDADGSDESGDDSGSEEDGSSDDGENYDEGDSSDDSENYDDGDSYDEGDYSDEEE